MSTVRVEEIRQKIDTLDLAIVTLLDTRGEFEREEIRLRAQLHELPRDSSRENLVLARVMATTKVYPQQVIRKIYETIFTAAGVL